MPSGQVARLRTDATFGGPVMRAARFPGVPTTGATENGTATIPLAEETTKGVAAPRRTFPAVPRPSAGLQEAAARPLQANPADGVPAGPAASVASPSGTAYVRRVRPSGRTVVPE